MRLLFLAVQENDGARAFGAVVGRLLFPLIGVLLIVLGLRRRRTGTTGAGTALIVAGAVLLVLSVLGILATLSGASAVAAGELTSVRRGS